MPNLFKLGLGFGYIRLLFYIISNKKAIDIGKKVYSKLLAKLDLFKHIVVAGFHTSPFYTKNITNF
jgi:hypothetical protein